LHTVAAVAVSVVVADSVAVAVEPKYIPIPGKAHLFQAKNE